MLTSGLCASCAGSPEKIEIDEGGTPFVGARVLVPFAQSDRLHALHAGDREKAVGWHHALALELDWTGGDAEQDIGPGETVLLDEVSLGPGLVRYDYELASLNLSAVNGMVFDNGVMLDVALGLNVTRLDLDAALVGGPRAVLRAESLGPKLGLQLGWLSPWRLSGRARFGYSAELPLDEHNDQVETRTFELGLFVPLGPWAGLDAGWRWTDYDAESSDSDIELDLDGPFVSLAFGPY